MSEPRAKNESATDPRPLTEPARKSSRLRYGTVSSSRRASGACSPPRASCGPGRSAPPCTALPCRQEPRAAAPPESFVSSVVRGKGRMRARPESWSFKVGARPEPPSPDRAPIDCDTSSSWALIPLSAYPQLVRSALAFGRTLLTVARLPVARLSATFWVWCKAPTVPDPLSLAWLRGTGRPASCYPAPLRLSRSVSAPDFRATSIPLGDGLRVSSVPSEGFFRLRRRPVVSPGLVHQFCPGGWTFTILGRCRRVALTRTTVNQVSTPVNKVSKNV